MAQRPWVTPAEVKAYTDIKSIADRSDEKLKVDISRAEQHVISLTHNRFSDEAYPTIPETVKTAVILATEVYGRNAVVNSKEFKSETFDDYSYTVAEGGGATLESLDLTSLLDEFIITKPTGNVGMKLRRL